MKAERPEPDFRAPRPFDWLVELASRLAPPGAREAWKMEWRAEISFALRMGRRRPAVLWRTVWCGIDAVWLWRREVPMSGWGADLKMAARSFLRSPMLNGVIVLTLAVGIGATSAMFTVVDGVLLRPLPLPEPDALVRFSQERPQNGQRGWGYSYAMYETLAAGVRAAELATYSNASFNVEGVDGPARVDGTRVSDSFFPVTGMRLQRGRTFTREEEAGDAGVMVVSHEFWRDFLGSDPDVLGRSISVSGRPFEIVGVLAEGQNLIRQLNQASGFQQIRDVRADLYLPLEPFGRMQAELTSTIQMLGRLRAGATVEQARTEVFDINDRFLADRGATGWRTEAIAVPDYIVQNSRTPLLILFGSVAVLLLILSANVAGLMLVRAVGRNGEWVARRALGASRGRIVRQIVTEAGLLAAVGGVAGVALAAILVGGIQHGAAAAIPRADELEISLRALVFALGAAGVTALLFGLGPALAASRGAPGEALASNRQTLSRKGRTALRALVAAQVTLALVLLSGSAVLLRSLGNLLEQDPGFDARHVIQGSVELGTDRYPSDADVARFATDVRQQLASLPGVEAAAVASVTMPLMGPRIRFQKEDVEGEDGQGGALQVGVSPEYFQVLDIGMSEGRALGPADGAQAPGVAVITPALAARYWPDESPVGKRIVIGSWRTFRTTGSSTPPITREIVGVTEEITGIGIDPGPPVEMLFAPFEQDPWRSQAYLVRATGEAGPVITAMRSAVLEADPSQPVFDMGPLLDDQREVIERERLSTTVLGGFAAVALILSGLGIYGVVAYSVALRRREIGIRVAVGADARSVSGLFLVEGLAPVALGVVAGLALAVVSVRLLEGLLYQVSPLDPVAFVAASTLLGAAAAVSTYLPARRTARIDPVEALTPE